MTRPDPHDAGDRLEWARKDEVSERFLAALNRELGEAQLPVASSPLTPAELPLIYIVGVPRSGTTLLHQLAARHLAVGYIDNLTARFWNRPSVGIVLGRSVGLGPIALRSRHGVSEGASGPHEFGYFWRRWLDLDSSPTHHLDEPAQSRVDRSGLRAALRDELLAWHGRPVVLKNLVCGFHARLLSDVHPRSVFVQVTRDRAEVARSIIRSRIDRYGDHRTWWSLKPSTYPFDEPNAAREVVRQVDDCLAELRRELSQPGVTAIEVAYDEVCAQPERALDAIREAVAQTGYALPALSAPIEELTASSGQALDQELEAELEGALTST